MEGAGKVAENQFQKLVDMLTASKELTYYDTRINALVMHNMSTAAADVSNLRKRIREITKNYSLNILYPWLDRCNMRLIVNDVKTDLRTKIRLRREPTRKNTVAS